MKRLAILFVALLFVSGCTTTPSAISKGELVDCSTLTVDSTVTGTQLDCLDGSAGIALEALRGPAIVNVWGSWCASCKDELPIIRSFYVKAKSKVQILGIDVEEAKSSDGADFVVKNGMTWPNVIDPDGRTRGNFGMGVPVTWFIDSAGKVVHKKIGTIKSEVELRDLTSKYLHITVS